MSLFMVCTCLSTISVNSNIQWIDKGRTWSTHQCHVSWESSVMTLSPYMPLTEAVFYRILTQVAETNDGDTNTQHCYVLGRMVA